MVCAISVTLLCGCLCLLLRLRPFVATDQRGSQFGGDGHGAARLGREPGIGDDDGMLAAVDEVHGLGLAHEEAPGSTSAVKLTVRWAVKVWPAGASVSDWSSSAISVTSQCRTRPP